MEGHRSSACGGLHHLPRKIQQQCDQKRNPRGKEFAENQVNAKLEAELSQIENAKRGAVSIGG